VGRGPTHGKIQKRGKILCQRETPGGGGHIASCERVVLNVEVSERGVERDRFSGGKAKTENRKEKKITDPGNIECTERCSFARIKRTESVSEQILSRRLQDS